MDNKIKKLTLEISPLLSNNNKFKKKLNNTTIKHSKLHEKFNHSFCKSSAVKGKLKKEEDKCKHNRSVIIKKSNIYKDVSSGSNYETNNELLKNRLIINYKQNYQKNFHKNLEDNFNNIETSIIDKKFENLIDHDEIIISSGKKGNNSLDFNINHFVYAKKNFGLSKSIKNKKEEKILDFNPNNSNKIYSNTNANENYGTEEFNCKTSRIKSNKGILKNSHKKNKIIDKESKGENVNFNLNAEKVSVGYEKKFEIKAPDIYSENDEYFNGNNKFDEYKRLC